MAKISFSKKHQELEQIAIHHNDVAEALRRYFYPADGHYDERFRGYSDDKLKDDLQSRLSEIDCTSALSVLSAMEAAFRIDYLQRCGIKKKDRLSRAFQQIYKDKKSHARLVEDILFGWKNEATTQGKRLISELIGAFKYRHWLAHGRYYEPKLGKKYDYGSVYELAVNVFISFPFVRVDALN